MPLLQVNQGSQFRQMLSVKDQLANILSFVNHKVSVIVNM